MFTLSITSTRHTTAYSCRSSWHFVVHSDTQCRRIHRTQSCSVGRSCLQFHCLLISFISRQRHYHQPRSYRQNVYWRHFFVEHRQRWITECDDYFLLFSLCAFVFLPSFLILYFDACCFTVYLLCLVRTMKTNEWIGELLQVSTGFGTRLLSNRGQQCQVPLPGAVEENR